LSPRCVSFPYTTLFRSIGGVRYPFLETERDVWTVDLPLDPGFYYVHLYVDNCLVLSPFLPIGYGHCRPANYIEVGPMEEFCLMRSEEHTSELQSRFDLV